MIEKTAAWYEERQKLGKYNQAGIISLCPVCDNGVNVSCDDHARFIEENWFHGPCSRFANSERLLVIADRIIEAIDNALLISPLFQCAAIAVYKRLRNV